MVGILVSSLSLNAAQSTPPTIAELAHQAQQQITDAPIEQTRRFVSGAGGAGGGGSDTMLPLTEEVSAQLNATTTLTMRPIERARVRRCVGNPPRQIDDPQSPPCVPFWQSGNGGATTKGVTANEIPIAVPNLTGDMRQTELTRAEAAFEKFFNTRFESHGRKLALRRLVTHCWAIAQDPALVRSDAVRADEEYHAFASTSYANSVGVDSAYYEELARRRVTSATSSPVSFDESNYQRFRPLHVELPADARCDGASHRGSDVPKSGWPARSVLRRRGAGPARNTRSRVFGLISTSQSGFSPSSAVLEAGLRGCGVQFAVQADAPMPTAAEFTAGYKNLMLQMKQNKVTTLTCPCQARAIGLLMQAATAQQYFPEWHLSSYYLGDWEVVAQRCWRAEQAPSAFAVSFDNDFCHGNRSLSTKLSVKSTQPSISTPSRRTEVTPPTTSCGRSIRYSCFSVRVVSSLTRTSPPNIGARAEMRHVPKHVAGGPPAYHGRVGFAGRHWMNEGGMLAWYAPSTPSYADVAGSFCYVAAGRRFAGGSYPTNDDGFFVPPSR